MNDPADGRSRGPPLAELFSNRRLQRANKAAGSDAAAYSIISYWL